MISPTFLYLLIVNEVYAILYSRHKVPEEILEKFNENIKKFDITILNIDSNNNIKCGTKKYKKLASNHFAKDLYLNIKRVLKKIGNNQPVFFIEPDVIYNENHFKSGTESIEKEPSFVHCNSNFVQQAATNDFRKYPSSVHIFSALSGTRDVLLYHVEEKIKEISSTSSVTWLEPGYHSNGRSYFVDYCSDYPIIEIRHGQNSTQIGVQKSTFGKQINDIANKSSKKIAVMCPLTNFILTYSVAGCVLDQLCLLSNYYQEVVFITKKDFKDHHLLPENIEVRYFDGFTGEDTPENYDSYVIKNYKSLVSAFDGIDTVIVHDIIFINGFMPYNILLRMASEFTKTNFVHYIHSAPTVIDRENLKYPETLNREPMKRSKYISLNQENINILSEMYMIDKKEITYIPNTIDPCIGLKFHPVATEIYREYKLWNYDIICTYPARLARGKQADKIITIMGEFKKCGLEPFLILANSYNNSKESIDMATFTNELIKSQNLENNVLLTSEYLSPWCEENNHNLQDGLPHEATMNFMQLSDLFILPSVSEGCSIIMLEAALTKNCIVLNDDLESLKSFGGEVDERPKKSTYIPFGGMKIQRIINPNSEKIENIAKTILQDMENNSNLNFFRYIRKFHSPDYVYNKILKEMLDG